MPHPIWLFFDVGNTLFSDDYGMSRVYLMLYQAIATEHPGVTFVDILTMREEQIIRYNDSQPHWSIGIRYFGREGWLALRSQILDDFDRNYVRYHQPAPDVVRVLHELAGEYCLGIAANQVRSCRAALEQFGLLEYLSVVWISDEIGLHKPNPAFFEGMLRAAGCAPEEAVMIGDRIDYDIQPAKALGMRAIQVYYRDESQPEELDEYARQYYASLRRARVAQVRPTSPAETPDAVITTLAALPAAVRKLE